MGNPRVSQVRVVGANEKKCARMWNGMQKRRDVHSVQVDLGDAGGGEPEAGGHRASYDSSADVQQLLEHIRDKALPLAEDPRIRGEAPELIVGSAATDAAAAVVEAAMGGAAGEPPKRPIMFIIGGVDAVCVILR